MGTCFGMPERRYHGDYDTYGGGGGYYGGGHASHYPSGGYTYDRRGSGYAHGGGAMYGGHTTVYYPGDEPYYERPHPHYQETTLYSKDGLQPAHIVPAVRYL